MRGVGIASPGVKRHGLGDHASQPLEPYEALHLADVAERARCDQHGVFEIQPAQSYVEIDHRFAPDMGLNAQFS